MTYIDLQGLYQPLPFKKYEGLDASRSKADCEGRYQAIKQNYGDFKDKTLIDLCCANGYFGFRFLQDGGQLVVGVDYNEKCRQVCNYIAEEQKLNMICIDVESITPKKVYETYKHFDIGIYLDTHYHGGTAGYLEYLKSMVDVLFTSPSRDSRQYEGDLKKIFINVENIYDEHYVDRWIFKCW